LAASITACALRRLPNHVGSPYREGHLCSHQRGQLRQVAANAEGTLDDVLVLYHGIV